MTEKYDPHTHGRASRENPAAEALRWEWDAADKLNAEHSGPGEWVPRRTVFVRDDINPRDGANLDYDRVKHYATVFRQLPPIKVQKDTFVVIDGKHRVSAAYESDASTEHILIEELDVPDNELWLAAFDANAEHGRALTTAERVSFAKRLIKEFPEWSDSVIARRAGVSRFTVMNHRPKRTEPVMRVGADGVAQTRQPSQVVENQQPIPQSPVENQQVLADEFGADVTIVARDADGNVLGEFSASSIEEDERGPYGANSSGEVERPVEPVSAGGAPSPLEPARTEEMAIGSDDWRNGHKKSPEQRWLNEVIRLGEGCPFQGGSQLQEAISAHPEPRRARAALGVFAILDEEMVTA